MVRESERDIDGERVRDTNIRAAAATAARPLSTGRAASAGIRPPSSPQSMRVRNVLVREKHVYLFALLGVRVHFASTLLPDTHRFPKAHLFSFFFNTFFFFFSFFLLSVPSDDRSCSANFAAAPDGHRARLVGDWPPSSSPCSSVRSPLRFFFFSSSLYVFFFSSRIFSVLLRRRRRSSTSASLTVPRVRDTRSRFGTPVEENGQDNGHRRRHQRVDRAFLQRNVQVLELQRFCKYLCPYLAAA